MILKRCCNGTFCQSLKGIVYDADWSLQYTMIGDNSSDIAFKMNHMLESLKNRNPDFFSFNSALKSWTI